MATMTLNMNGLPAIEAVNDSYSFPTTHVDNLILPVLDNDFLGFGGISITLITDNNVELNVGTLVNYSVEIPPIISDYNKIGVILTSPGSINIGVYTFTYTIEDSYARTDTATVTITITA